MIGPFGGKEMVTWTPGKKSLEPLATTKGLIDGIEVLGPDRILFTSWADSTLSILRGGKIEPVATGLPSPADIGVDLKRRRVAIPLLLLDRIEFREVPAITP